MGGENGCERRDKSIIRTDFVKIQLVREIVHMSGESQEKVREFLKTSDCAGANHVNVLLFYSYTPLSFND